MAEEHHHHPVRQTGHAARRVLWDRDRYGILFALLLIDYVILSLSNSYQWATLVRTVPVAVTLLFAVHTSGASRHVLRFSQLAVAASLLLGIVQGITNDAGLGDWSFALVTLLLLITPLAVLRRVFEHGRVDVETVFAALSLYVIIGLIFSQAFVFISRVHPQPPFLAQTSHPSLSDFVYLSFVTITTVGFGDITARTDFGRSVVVLEALIGQIFLVTLVARLVAMYGMEIPARLRSRHLNEREVAAATTDAAAPTGSRAPAAIPQGAAIDEGAVDVPAPPGTAPPGTALSGTAPPGTAPPGTAPPGTAPPVPPEPADGGR